MGNIVGSLATGFLKVVGDLFGATLDFLSGKSCSSVCGSTWDLICYIENFCVANLVKLATVSALFYIVLLFFYLLYKIGICHCVGKGMCKMLWACLVSCFSSCEYATTFIWFKIKKLKREKSDIEMYDSSSSADALEEERISYRYRPKSVKFSRSRERRRSHLERSLRPRSHRIRVGIDRGSVHVSEFGPRRHGRRHDNAAHSITVTHTSIHKGGGRRTRGRRW